MIVGGPPALNAEPINPVPPDNLPLDRTFSDIECVIWRTGWEQDDLVFGLKCGAYGGKFFRDNYLAKEYPFTDTRAPRSFQLSYVLHPATMWEEFGPVNLSVFVPKGIGFKSSIPVSRKKDSKINGQLFTEYTATLTKHTDKKGELFLGTSYKDWQKLLEKPASNKQVQLKGGKK